MQNARKFCILLMLSVLLFMIHHSLFCANVAKAQVALQASIDVQSKLSIPDFPQRIVVMPLFAEEMLLEMIGPTRIVGVGHEYYENGEVYSPTIALTHNIKGGLAIDNPEGILAVNPDLVVLWEADFFHYETLLPALERAGVLTLFVEEPQSFDKVIENLMILGEVAGAQEKAAEMVLDIQTTLAQLSQTVSSIPEGERKRATHYQDYAPSITFDVIAEAANIISDCGRVFVNNAYHQEINDKLLSEWNPDLITFTPFYTDTDGAVLGFGKDYADGHAIYLLAKPDLKITSAVKTRNIHPLSIHNSQYMVQSAIDLAHLAYPDLFSEQGN